MLFMYSLLLSFLRTVCSFFIVSFFPFTPSLFGILQNPQNAFWNWSRSGLLLQRQPLICEAWAEFVKSLAQRPSKISETENRTWWRKGTCSGQLNSAALEMAHANCHHMFCHKWACFAVKTLGTNDMKCHLRNVKATATMLHCFPQAVETFSIWPLSAVFLWHLRTLVRFGQKRQASNQQIQ